MEKGFIKVPRGIAGWREFSDPALFYAYFALMSNIRFSETEIDGILVGVGQLLMSKTQLSELFGMSVSRTRSALLRFEKMGGIVTENIKNKYTLITVLEPFITGVKNNKNIPKKKASDKNKSEYAGKTEIRADVEKKNEADVKTDAFPLNSEEKCEDRKNTAKDEILCSEKIKMCDSSEKTETVAEHENKLSYGKFNNVFLTDCEYNDFRNLTPNFSFFIDSLSAKLMNSGTRKYNSHYALLINNFNEEKLRRQGFAEPENKFGICSSNNASYDIKRAEERAKTVPKVKKRERR